MKPAQVSEVEKVVERRGVNDNTVGATVHKSIHDVSES